MDKKEPLNGGETPAEAGSAEQNIIEFSDLFPESVQEIAPEDLQEEDPAETPDETEKPTPEKKRGPSGKKPAGKRAPKPRETSEEAEPKPHSQVVRRILAGILTLLLVVLAVLVFVFRDELTGAGLRKLFGREAKETAAREAFTYETGAEQVFAPAGDGLAVASSSSAQLLNAAGETVFKQVTNFDSPAVFGAARGALFCDVGGSGGWLHVAADGTLLASGHGSEILTAGMNEDGWFYLVTAEAGYKGLVSVYNDKSEKQYEWWSGSGYVLRAAIAPDNRALAVLCAEREGAKIHFFALNSDAERAAVTVADTLLIDLCYTGSDSVCAVGETGLWFFRDDGEALGQYPLDGRYLLDYAFDRASFVTVFVSDYRSGAGGTLVNLGSDGRVLGTAALDRDVISMSAAGRQLLVMTGGELALYSQDLARQSANETLMTARRAILRPAGDILLLHAYSAEKFSF